MFKLDFDVIMLGYGSGGLFINCLLDSGVFDVFKNDLFDKRYDGVILDLSGFMVFMIDSFVILFIFFFGGNIGELVVNGIVNDLVMCGVILQYLLLSFIIEEGLEMKVFWDILVVIKFVCVEVGV